MKTDYSDYVLGFYYPTDADDEHYCHLTERRVNMDIENGTFNKHCPLWLNQEWHLRKNN